MYHRIPSYFRNEKLRNKRARKKQETACVYNDDAFRAPVGCTLGDDDRDCSYCDCHCCGWNEDEIKRRRAVIKYVGLKSTESGTRRLNLEDKDELCC